MPWIWKSWTWKSVPVCFVSSELCFLPIWLTSVTPRTKAGRALEVPVMLSVAVGGPTWEPELGPDQKRKYSLEDWLYHSYLSFESSAERFVSVLNRFSNPHSRSYKSKWALCPAMVKMVRNLPIMQKTGVQSLGSEDFLEKWISTHSSILAWRIPWTEEPGGLQSMGSQRVWHNWVTNTLLPEILRLISLTLPLLTMYLEFLPGNCLWFESFKTFFWI